MSSVTPTPPPQPPAPGQISSIQSARVVQGAPALADGRAIEGEVTQSGANGRVTVSTPRGDVTLQLPRQAAQAFQPGGQVTIQPPPAPGGGQTVTVTLNRAVPQALTPTGGAELAAQAADEAASDAPEAPASRPREPLVPGRVATATVVQKADPAIAAQVQAPPPITSDVETPDLAAARPGRLAGFDPVAAAAALLARASGQAQSASEAGVSRAVAELIRNLSGQPAAQSTRPPSAGAVPPGSGTPGSGTPGSVTPGSVTTGGGTPGSGTIAGGSPAAGAPKTATGAAAAVGGARMLSALLRLAGASGTSNAAAGSAPGSAAATTPAPDPTGMAGRGGGATVPGTSPGASGATVPGVGGSAPGGTAAPGARAGQPPADGSARPGGPPTPQVQARPASQPLATASGGGNAPSPQTATSGGPAAAPAAQGAAAQGAAAQGAASQGFGVQGGAPQGAAPQGATSQGAAASVAAQPASFAPLTDPREGTSFQVRVLSVGGQASLAALAAAGDRPGAQLVNATVVAVTSAGRPILATPIGLLSLDALAGVPRDTPVRLEVLPRPQPPPGGTAPPPAPLVTLAREWPSLEEALRTLQTAAAPEAAAQAAQTAVARPGPQLTAAMAFLFSALRGGDLRSLLGGDATRALERARGALAGVLREELATLQRATEPSDGGWRAFFLPFSDGDTMQQLGFWVHQDPDQDRDGEGAEKGTHFVVTLDLSQLGDLRIDGRVEEKKVDLILRTTRSLPREMRAEILELFTGTLERTGVTGRLRFQAGGPFPPLPIERLHGYQERRGGAIDA